MKGWPGRALQALGLLTLLGFLGGAAGLYFAAHWLRTDDRPESARAIVVLGGQYSRPFYGADLYNQGLAPLVLVSRPVPDPSAAHLEKIGIRLPEQGEVYREVLVRKGVPEAAIRFFGQDLVSTLEEAEVLARLLGPEPGTLLVVTSPSHTRRAKLIFEKALPRARILVLATPYEEFAPRWWTDFRSATAVTLETAKTLWMLFGSGFRSTDAPAANRTGAD